MNRLGALAAADISSCCSLAGMTARPRRRTWPITEPRSGVRVLRSDVELQAAVARAVEFERVAHAGLTRRLDCYAKTLSAAPPTSVLQLRRQDDVDATAVRQSA